MAIVPHPPHCYAPRLKVKLRCRHFDTGEGSRQNRRRCWTPSQNTTSRMHLINNRRVGNGGAYARKGILRAMVTSSPKVSIWPDDSTSPGKYGSLQSGRMSLVISYVLPVQLLSSVNIHEPSEVCKQRIRSLQTYM
jgi:hypothetical protein